MKKIFQNIAILLLLCSVFSLNVAAADFKTGELITEENQVQIEGLEKNILSDLYNSSLSDGTRTENTLDKSVDFEKAQQVYTFKPDVFVSIAEKDDFLDIYKTEGVVVWKVPVDVSSNYCDYAVIGQGLDGKYNYTTVSAPIEEIDSVRYLFYPEEESRKLGEKCTSATTTDILSIPMYGIDLIMVKSEEMTEIIPNTTQDIGLRNGTIYSKEEIVNFVEQMIEENRTAADAGGGMGVSSPMNQENSARFSYVIVLGIGTCLAIYVCIRQVKAYKREKE